MIKIEVENLEELKALLGQKDPEPKADPEMEKKLKAEIAKYKEMLKLATDNATRLQAKLDELTAKPAEPVMPEPQGESVPMETAPAPAAKLPSLAEVRAVLKELQDAKGTDAVRALIEPYGVKAISKVPEEYYGRVLDSAKEALNA